MFQEVNARIETAFSVTITYMEIYNEKIFDLLVDPAVNATKVGERISKGCALACTVPVVWYVWWSFILYHPGAQLGVSPFLGRCKICVAPSTVS